MVAKSIAKIYTNIHKPTDYTTVRIKNIIIIIITGVDDKHRRLDKNEIRGTC